LIPRGFESPKGGGCVTFLNKRVPRNGAVLVTWEGKARADWMTSEADLEPKRWSIKRQWKNDIWLIYDLTSTTCRIRDSETHTRSTKTHLLQNENSFVLFDLREKLEPLFSAPGRTFCAKKSRSLHSKKDIFSHFFSSLWNLIFYGITFFILGLHRNHIWRK